MAPELFEGHVLRFPCDIYSFGMTVYEVGHFHYLLFMTSSPDIALLEIFTHEIPFGSVALAHLHRLIVEKHTRPDRPSDLEAPQLTESIWQIVKQCWAQQPKDRPMARLVCQKLSALRKFQRREYIGSSTQCASSLVPHTPSPSPTFSPLITEQPPVPLTTSTFDMSPHHSDQLLSTSGTIYFDPPMEGQTSSPLPGQKPSPTHFTSNAPQGVASHSKMWEIPILHFRN